MAPLATCFLVALLPINALAFGGPQQQQQQHQLQQQQLHNHHLSFPVGRSVHDAKKLEKRAVVKRAPSALPIKIADPQQQQSVATTSSTTSSHRQAASQGYHAGVYASGRQAANVYATPNYASPRPLAAVTSGSDHRVIAAASVPQRVSSQTPGAAFRTQNAQLAAAVPAPEATAGNRRTKTMPQSAATPAAVQAQPEQNTDNVFNANHAPAVAAVAAPAEGKGRTKTMPGSAPTSSAQAGPSSSASSSLSQSQSQSQSNGNKLNTVIGSSSWKLANDWSGSDFLNSWDFFDYPDPTHGLVDYVSGSQARSAGLAYVQGDGTFVMKVDDSTTLSSGQSRKSVRITSPVTVGIGSLIVFDANKIPYGPATWPAFWTVGPNWPSGGEIDIVENVHESLQNQMTLHTTAGCTLAQPMAASGVVETTNCDASVNYNVGCGVVDPSSQSFGAGFSQNGGGVWATIIDTTGISIWFFPRGSVPSDLKSKSPNPANWGTPKARWSSSTCNISKYFAAQTIVINTTLCGDWAGGTWAQQGIAGTCADAVANPANFVNANWEINGVTVYSKA